MNIAIRYFSKKGHTKEVAAIIGEALNVTPEPISVPLDGHVDLLFLGGAFYFMHPAKELEDFIKTLTREQVEVLAVFSTTFGPENASSEIAKKCKEHGLTVMDRELHCTDHELKEPEETEKIKAFAKEVVASMHHE